MRNNQKNVTVWDLPVRLFHWLLVLGFSCAYLTAIYHLGFLHTYTGYFLCILLLARMIWGFAGSKYARFSSFTYSIAETAAYLRSLTQRKPKRYLGHNPAGALMVFTLLSVLSLTLLTGLITLAVIDFEGPLLFLNAYFNDETSYTLRHLHGWLVNAALFLIPVHLIGVAQASIQHKENLLKAMFTGKKNFH